MPNPNGLMIGVPEMIKTKFVQKRMVELTDGFKVTDSIFMRDPSTVLSITYEENTTGLQDTEGLEDEVERRTEGGEYPVVNLSAEVKQALIEDYGLATVVTYEAITYNKIASVKRSFLKLGKALIRYVDIKGLEILTDNYNPASTKINVMAAGTPFTSAEADPFAVILQAKAKGSAAGYDVNTALINPVDLTNALTIEKFRKELDQNVPEDRRIVKKGLIAGQVGGVTLIQANNIREGSMWVGEDQVVGNRSETTNGVEVDTYKTGNSKKASTRIDVFREFTDYMTDPLAGTLVSGLQ